jgi:hypothetical protein
MQIDIDFDVFKALTALRQSEVDSYNDVLRRVLLIASTDLDTSGNENPDSPNWKGTKPRLGAAAEAIGRAGGDVYFGNTCFPKGTRFKAIYKGQSYSAEVRDGKWVGEDGIVRRSPSDAACAISNTNVNGWRFWHVLRPGDSDWVRLDALRK